MNKIYEKAKKMMSHDPEASFQEDHALLGRPFYFPGNNGRAVLLVHGWTSAPYELRRLGIFLNKNGYSVMGPTLKGHGSHPKDLNGVRWEEWFADVEKAYAELRKNHSKVYVAGTSMGASLVALLAARGADVSGLVLMAMPHTIKKQKIGAWLIRLVSLFKTYHKKHYPSGFGNSEFITRKISYQSYPLKSVLEVFRLGKIVRKELSKITQPCFVMQSTSDHIITADSLEKIFSGISSKKRRKKYIEKAYHTFISDIKNSYVFEEILSFFEEN